MGDSSTAEGRFAGADHGRLFPRSTLDASSGRQLVNRGSWLLQPDVLILDDFGVRKFTPSQAKDTPEQLMGEGQLPRSTMVGAESPTTLVAVE